MSEGSEEKNFSILAFAAGLDKEIGTETLEEKQQD